MPRLPLVALAALAILVALPLGDGLLLDGFHGVGYCVCHQIPSHSIFIDEQQLPLCARCTGIYLGFLTAMLGLAVLGKLRASGLPPGRVMLILLVAFGAMVVDGFNSLASLFPGVPTLYEPSNLLRLTTGAAAGCGLALLILPSLNDSLWANQDQSQSVSDLGELVGFGVLEGLMVATVYSAQPWLLYPVSALSIIGVFVALSSAATSVVTALAGRGRAAVTWSAAAPLLLAGLGLSSASMVAVGTARALLSPLLGV